MDNSVMRKNLLYELGQLRDQRGSDYSGVKALRMAILKSLPVGYTVIDDYNECICCGAWLCDIDIEHGECNYCPVCGLRIIKEV